MNQLLTWIEVHSLISAIAVLSTGLLLLSILATPWLVSRLPENYLLNINSHTAVRSPVHLVLVVSRSIIGFAVIVLGLVMIVTPGPGLIMILLGISLAEFPGKRALFLFLATRPTVFRSLNWIRKRRSMPPFQHPYGKDAW